MTSRDSEVREAIEALRSLSDAASPGPWGWNSYSRIDSIPVSRQYNEAEALIPDDAPDDDPRWAALPDTAACYVPHIERGDLATKQGEANARFIEAAINTVHAILDRSSEAAPTPEPFDYAAHNRHMDDVTREVMASEAAPVVGLSEAWAKAEAALPEDRRNATWGVSRRVGEDAYYAWADDYGDPRQPSENFHEATGPTPAAALTELAARLTQTRTLGEAGT